MPEARVYVIGVAPTGAASLAPETRRLVNEAEIVFGGQRLLDMFPDLPGEKMVIKNNPARTADLIQENLGRKRMVVLASGDPGFYGIGRYLAGRLGREAIEVIPGVSAMQLAFARIGESWDDAALTSVHSRPIEDIVDLVRSSCKTGIFTDDKHTPAEIARVLEEHGVGSCRAYVCQDLGGEREKVLAADLYELKEMEFSPLNVLILVRDAGEKVPARPGIPDERFHRTREGLITKMEVRAISLARLRPPEDGTVWDVGAGSGAVSVEASLLAGRGTVYAVEKDGEAVAVIRENIRRFGRNNIRVIPGKAPECLEELPDPDAVFVGGSGGRMAEILRTAGERLKPGGRIVVNAVTLETLQTAAESLKAGGFNVEITLVNVARGKDIAGLSRLEALNPVFIISGRRATEGDDGQ